MAASDLGHPFSRPRAIVTITLLLLLSALVVAVLAYGRYRPGRRERAMREVLDAADALEAQLRVARAEIEAVAGSGGEDPVGEAMREMLRQRLWLRDHGRDASLAQLDEVRSSIDAARGRIDQQLSRIAQARAPVA
jgi:hypothetical protein